MTISQSCAPLMIWVSLGGLCMLGKCSTSEPHPSPLPRSMYPKLGVFARTRWCLLLPPAFIPKISALITFGLVHFDEGESPYRQIAK